MSSLNQPEINNNLSQLHKTYSIRLIDECHFDKTWNMINFI